MIYSGGFSLGVPPLPIPNREVKPKRADGTAPQCGRVGRRLFFTITEVRGVNPQRTSVFFVPIACVFCIQYLMFVYRR